MRSETSPRRRTAPILVLALGALLLGCGHPATREECDELFNKNAEIELKAQRITDPKTVAERTAAARAAEGEAFASRCLGRRLTQRALVCVRRATTAEQVDRCF